MKTYDASKIGCDYNHLWDEEMGYPDTLSSVKNDAEGTVNEFLEQNTDFHIRCSYSGIWGPR